MKSKQFNMRIDPSTDKRLTVAAALTQQSKGELMYVAFYEYIDSRSDLQTLLENALETGASTKSTTKTMKGTEKREGL